MRPKETHTHETESHIRQRQKELKYPNSMFRSFDHHCRSFGDVRLSEVYCSCSFWGDLESSNSKVCSLKKISSRELVSLVLTLIRLIKEKKSMLLRYFHDKLAKQGQGLLIELQCCQLKKKKKEPQEDLSD